MTQNPSQIGSPEWVTEKIELGQERLIQFLEKLPGSIFLIYLLAIAAAATAIINVDLIVSNMNGPSELLGVFRMTAFLLPLVVIPRLFVKTSGRSTYELIVTLAFFLLSIATYMLVWWPRAQLSTRIIFGIEYFFPILLFFLTRGLDYRLRVIILLVGVTAASVAADFAGFPFWLILRLNMILPVSLLMFEEAEGLSLNAMTLQRFFLSPILLFTPFPVEHKDREIIEGSKRLYVMGAIDFAKAIISMFICWLMLDPRIRFDDSDFFTALLHGYWQFALLVFLRISWSFLFVGAGRWMGFNMSDPIRVPFLAINFFDFKKRSQIYVFNWAIKLFYDPIFRKTGSAFLAAFFAFTIESAILSWSRYTSSLVQYLTSAAIPIVIAAALAGFSAATPSLWPSGKKWSGWLGVLIVNVVLGLLTGAQYYLPR